MTGLFVFLIILSGAANGMMDLHSFWWSTSIYKKWFDQLREGSFVRDFIRENSWENKYKYRDIQVFKRLPPDNWLNKFSNYLINYLLQGVFVGLTDAWHFFKSIMLFAWKAVVTLSLPPVLENPYLNFIIIYIGVSGMYFVGFYLTSHFLRRGINTERKKYVSNFVKTYWYFSALILMVAGFVISYLVSTLGGVTLYWTNYDTAALLIFLLTFGGVMWLLKYTAN